MSRIGKQPITIPEGVEIKIDNGQISVKGPKGELKQDVNFQMDLVMEDKELKVKPKGKGKNFSAIWGLTRALIANMVKGVTEGFEKKLEIEGVGYKVVMEGEKLVLSLGLSHLVYVEAPEGIKISVEKNVMTVTGIDKQLVGQITAKIRDLKKPEPYKGKGIHYVGEVIRRKAGKKVVGSE